MKDYLKSNPNTVHIAAETLAFAGLFLYFKRQLQDLRHQANLSAVYLSNRISELETQVQRHDFILESKAQPSRFRSSVSSPPRAPAKSKVIPAHNTLIGEPINIQEAELQHQLLTETVKEQGDSEQDQLLDELVENEVRTMLDTELEDISE